MDLYQVFTTHNRPWSPREILWFSILFLITAVILFILVYRKKLHLSQAIGGLLLLLFLGIVFASTVFTRPVYPTRQYELELFWSWKAAWRGSEEMKKEIFLNCLLLLPMGILLPVIFRKRLSWWKGLALGFLVSAAIETSQLIFCRGLFEWDDMIHNAFGCMIGCILSSFFYPKNPKRN